MPLPKFDVWKGYQIYGNTDCNNECYYIFIIIQQLFDFSFKYFSKHCYYCCSCCQYSIYWQYNWQSICYTNVFNIDFVYSVVKKRGLASKCISNSIFVYFISNCR